MKKSHDCAEGITVGWNALVKKLAGNSAWDCTYHRFLRVGQVDRVGCMGCLFRIFLDFLSCWVKTMWLTYENRCPFSRHSRIPFLETLDLHYTMATQFSYTLIRHCCNTLNGHSEDIEYFCKGSPLPVARSAVYTTFWARGPKGNIVLWHVYPKIHHMPLATLAPLCTPPFGPKVQKEIYIFGTCSKSLSVSFTWNAQITICTPRDNATVDCIMEITMNRPPV